jgi:sugar-specific transcriptional regulator TrmB
VGKHRSEIYRSLKELEELGLVEVSLHKVSNYTAVTPKVAISSLMQQKQRTLSLLEEERDHMTDLLGSFQSQAIEPSKPDRSNFVRVNIGLAAYRNTENLFNHAESEVLMVLGPTGLRDRILTGSERADRSAGEKVRFRILTEVTRDSLHDVLKYSEFCEMRHLYNIAKILHYGVVDDSDVLIPLTGGSYVPDELSVIWTNNQLILRALRQDFEDKWKEGSDVKQVIRTFKRRKTKRD